MGAHRGASRSGRGPGGPAGGVGKGKAGGKEAPTCCPAALLYGSLLPGVLSVQSFGPSTFSSPSEELRTFSLNWVLKLS